MGFIFEIIKFFFDLIYGIILGSIMAAYYFGYAICIATIDLFTIFVLWKTYKVAEQITTKK